MEGGRRRSVWFIWFVSLVRSLIGPKKPEQPDQLIQPERLEIQSGWRTALPVLGSSKGSMPKGLSCLWRAWSSHTRRREQCRKVLGVEGDLGVPSFERVRFMRICRHSLGALIDIPTGKLIGAGSPA
jgi:hypothetical protein